MIYLLLCTTPRPEPGTGCVTFVDILRGVVLVREAQETFSLSTQLSGRLTASKVFLCVLVLTHKNKKKRKEC